MDKVFLALTLILAIIALLALLSLQPVLQQQPKTIVIAPNGTLTVVP